MFKLKDNQLKKDKDLGIQKKSFIEETILSICNNTSYDPYRVQRGAQIVETITIRRPLSVANHQTQIKASSQPLPLPQQQQKQQQQQRFVGQSLPSHQNSQQAYHQPEVQLGASRFMRPNSPHNSRMVTGPPQYLNNTMPLINQHRYVPLVPTPNNRNPQYHPNERFRVIEAVPVHFNKVEWPQIQRYPNQPLTATTHGMHNSSFLYNQQPSTFATLDSYVTPQKMQDKQMSQISTAFKSKLNTSKQRNQSVSELIEQYNRTSAKISQMIDQMNRMKNSIEEMRGDQVSVRNH